MTDDEVFAITPPRNLTGAPGHDALRAAWGVPVGGNGKRPDERKSNDVVTNHARAVAAYNERRAAQPLEREADIRAAHADRLAGAKFVELMVKYDIPETTLRRGWRRLGLEVPGRSKTQ